MNDFTNPTDPTAEENTSAQDVNTTETETEKVVSEDFEDFTVLPDGSTRKINLTVEPDVPTNDYNPNRYSNQSQYDPKYSAGPTNTNPYGNGQNYQGSTPTSPYQTPPYQAPPQAPPYQAPPRQQTPPPQPNPGYHAPGQYSTPTNNYAPPYNVNVTINQGTGASPKSKIVMIILCCLGFFGCGGIHRVYAGNIGTGVLWLFTGGLCWIGTIIDLILIITDQFTDCYGNPIIYN